MARFTIGVALVQPKLGGTLQEQYVLIQQNVAAVSTLKHVTLNSSLRFRLQLLVVKNTGLESREYGRRDPSRWPRGTLYQQKLVLTSPTSGGRSVGIVRSRTRVTEFSFIKFLYFHIFIIKNNKTNSVAWVRERTIPTERLPLVGGVSANFCG
jgi:hypothetical protein